MGCVSANTPVGLSRTRLAFSVPCAFVVKSGSACERIGGEGVARLRPYDSRRALAQSLKLALSWRTALKIAKARKPTKTNTASSMALAKTRVIPWSCCETRA